VSSEDTRALFENIDTSTLIGLRDRALIGVMAYSFARIGAVLAMRVENYLPIGKGWFLRLHEKGGKQLEVPAHHLLERYLDAYIEAAGLVEPKAPLFCSALRRTGLLTRSPMRQGDAYKMVRRALKAGIAPAAVPGTLDAAKRGAKIAELRELMEKVERRWQAPERNKSQRERRQRRDASGHRPK
jgi:integrase